MLSINLARRVCGAGICTELHIWCNTNMFTSCVARQVFGEITDRHEYQVFESFSEGSTFSSFQKIIQTKKFKESIDIGCAKYDNAHEGIRSICQINGSGSKPSEIVLCGALSSCAKTLHLSFGLQIHAQIVQIGYGENLFLNSALVDLYAKCNAIVCAKMVFERMKKHDQVSWTSIISGLTQNGHGREAILMFKEMMCSPIKPNCFTYVSILSACTGLKEAFEQGLSIHAHVMKLGFDTNSFVVSSLIDIYSKCGKVDQAKLLFDETLVRDNIVLNSMISGYSQNLCGEEALRLFIEMRNDNMSPTDHTLSSILSACGSLTVLKQGRQVHSLVIKMGSESNVFVISALIDMYSKCGSIDEARRIFDKAVERNSVLWTSMMTGYAQSGRGSEALELFDCLMMETRFMPDHICFTAVLTACNHAGFLDKGIEYLNSMKRDYGLVPQIDQYACLIDLYARNGHLTKAKELMETMPYNPNYVIWSSFLSSCKTHGNVELGKEAANQLFKMEPGNAAPYVTLASIYAKAGLWNDVAEIRNLMQKKGIRKIAGWSWIEVDKNVHIFSVGDAIHHQSLEIYAELEKLYLEMKSST